LRIGPAFVLLAVCLGSASCGALGPAGNPASPSGAPPSGSTIAYAAIGASDVTGIGSSVPCFSLFLDCLDGMGYVFVAARQLRSQGYLVNVTNLGVPAAVISRGFQALGRQYGRDIPANFLDQQAPFVPSHATLVTIFAGPNEANTITSALGGGAGGSDPAAFIDAQVRSFRDDYAALLAEVRRRAAGARIIVLNVPNLAAMPYLASAPLLQRQAAQRIATGMTTTVINPLVSQGVRVIDLMCDPRLYQSTTYSGDGFHPSDAGYAVLAGEVVQAVVGGSYPAPQSNCPYMSLVP
jgi:lysophospholipase L1-like esterase